MRKTTRNGLTLAEVMISSSLAGVVIVGSLQATGAILTTWQTASDMQHGPALAHDLMSEILAQPYEDPDQNPIFGREGGEGGADRKNWDDVDDYNGWSQSPPEDKDKKKYHDLEGWTRSSVVEYINLNNPSAVIGADQGVKRITVEVTDPFGNVSTMIAFRSRWGLMEESLPMDSTIQGHVHHELDLDSAHYYGSTQVNNHAVEN